MTRPRLIMTLLVRDAADIVAENVAWHLAQGVDHVIATDNGSVDGTVEALEPFARDGALTLLHEPSRAYLQDIWTTRMALMARDRMGADWVICNDADEFWCAPSGRLHDVLPDPSERPCLLVCRRHNMIGPRDALLSVHWADALVYRAVSPPVLPPSPETEADVQAIRFQTTYFQHQVPAKVIFPTRGLSRVKRGAHGGIYDGHTPEERDCAVEIVHFPVRSLEDFDRTVRRIGSSVRGRPELPQLTSWKYRRWLAMAEKHGSIWPAYREALPDRRQVAADLAAGNLIEDRSMSRALRSLPASRLPEPATAPPAVAARDDGGRLILVSGPDGAACASVGGLLIRLGATPPLNSDGEAQLPAVHTAILAEIGANGPAPVDPARFAAPVARAYRATLFETLMADFADLNQAVVADARLCRLLPLWRELCKERHMGLSVVLCVGALPEHEADALPWARRILDAERNSRGLPRFAVLNHDLAADWRAALGPAEAWIAPDRTGPLLPGENAPPADLSRQPLVDDCFALVCGILDAMQALAAGGDTPLLTAAFDRLGADLDRACGVLPPDDQAVRRQVLERCRALVRPRGIARRLRLRRLVAEIRAAPEFDPDWYLAAYPDVAESGADPARHFVRHGAAEGRNPGPRFDTLAYYQAHPDVLAAGQIALLHYCRSGRAEGRAILPALPAPA